MRCTLADGPASIKMMNTQFDSVAGGGTRDAPRGRPRASWRPRNGIAPEPDCSEMFCWQTGWLMCPACARPDNLPIWYCAVGPGCAFSETKWVCVCGDEWPRLLCVAFPVWECNAGAFCLYRNGSIGGRLLAFLSPSWNHIAVMVKFPPGQVCRVYRYHIDLFPKS